jgi:hypothetical protein
MRHLGQSKSQTPRVHLDRPSIWDACQKSTESRDIRHREIRVPEVEGVGTSQVSKSSTRSEPSICEDTWRDREPIGISEFWKARLPEHQKSRKREIGSGPSACGDAWQRSRPSGKVPMRRPSIRVWFIGISEIPVTSYLCTLESRNAKPRSVGDNCQCSGESGFEESGIPWMYVLWY